MDIIKKYLALVHEKRFAEALPVIEQILERAPHISTSWFNYGVCLAALGRHDDAANAFLEAYALVPDDGGALLRACLALAAADNATRLLELFQRECERDPAMINLFLEEEAFAPFFEQPGFEELSRRFLRH